MSGTAHIDPALLWKPNPGPQTTFLRLRIREALFGGAAGGGKTAALIMSPLQLVAFEHNRWIKGEITRSTLWCIHFRRVMPRLLQTINKAHGLYRAVDPGVKYNDSNHAFTFTCGAKIQFGHMEKDVSYLDYLGQEYQSIVFDELTEFTEEQYTNLLTRLRSADPKLAERLEVRSASNPVGKGLDWVRRRFIDQWPEGNRVIRERIPLSGEVIYQDRIFIPSRLKDNPWLDRAYEATLANQPAHVRRALLDGDWYVVPGAFFAEEWIKDVHVIKPFKIPSGWPRYRSCDYGYNAPASVSWWAIDQDDNAICYRNLYVKKHTAEMLANRIREIEEDAGEWDTQRGRSKIFGPIDPATKAITGHAGPSIMETMQMMGINWFAGDNARIPGWDQMRKRLVARRKSPILDKLTGAKNRDYPALMWFDTCVNPIRTLPSLPADEHNAEDVDTESDDHHADECRYFCMSRPFAATNDNGKWDEDNGPDDIAIARASKSRAAAGAFSYSGW